MADRKRRPCPALKPLGELAALRIPRRWPLGMPRQVALGSGAAGNALRWLRRIKLPVILG